MFTVEFTSRQYAAAVLALLQDARTTSCLLYTSLSASSAIVGMAALYEAAPGNAYGGPTSERSRG